jgi:drug/metabolite transporter (DMT)-like permease
MMHTSVAHSLLFLYSCPILLVFYYLAIRKSLSKFQIFGAGLGFAGLGLMCFMSSSNEGTTWYGDLISLCGALVLCVNLIVSEKPMNEFPISFLFGIHLISAAFCTVLSVSLEEDDRDCFFEVFYRFQGVYAVYLGVVCGFIGNGAFYLLLKRVDPFVVSVIINFDPVVGSAFAWGFGILDTPGVFTFVGGAFVVVGNLIATVVKKNDCVQNEENLEVISVSITPNENIDQSYVIQVKPENSEGISETCQMN